MTIITADTAVLLLTASLTCYGLGTAIFRRLDRTREIMLLLLILSTLGTVYLLQALTGLLQDNLQIKVSYVLKNVQMVMGLCTLAFLTHFLSLTFQRIGEQDVDAVIEVKRWASWGWGNWCSGPQLLSHWRRVIHRTYLMMGYGAAALGLMIYGWAFARTLLAGWDERLEIPGASSKFGSGMIGAVYGVYLGSIVPLLVIIFLSLYQRLPISESASSASPGWLARLSHLTVRFSIGGQQSLESIVSRTASLEDWKAFRAVMIGTAMGLVLLASRLLVWRQVRMGMVEREHLEVIDLVLLLLPLFVLLPLVYYKMRFVFFDILIKRGVMSMMLLILSAIWFFDVLRPLQQMFGGSPARAGAGIAAGNTAIVTWVGIILFAVFWIAVYQGLTVRLDRYLFHRPDYGKLLVEIGTRLRSIIEAPTAIGYVTGRLQEALGATEVKLVESRPASSSAPASDLGSEPPSARSFIYWQAVAADDRQFGYLFFGRRSSGQQYQSEDLSFFAAVANQLAWALRQFELRDEYEQQARREQDLRELAARSELKALRAQINPHFLFNALNIAVDLTTDDPKLAEETLVNLSHVFRYALEATKRETVRLGEELDFIRAYLEIEHARFEDKLSFEITVSDECRGLMVPPMLIQPLVENAIRHGIAPKIGGGRVTVDIRWNSGTVRVRVADDGIGFDPQLIESRSGSGIGLANVRERVARLYGANRWHLESAVDEGTVIEFEMGEEQAEWKAKA